MTGPSAKKNHFSVSCVLSGSSGLSQSPSEKRQSVNHNILVLLSSRDSNVPNRTLGSAIVTLKRFVFET